MSELRATSDAVRTVAAALEARRGLRPTPQALRRLAAALHDECGGDELEQRRLVAHLLDPSARGERALDRLLVAAISLETYFFRDPLQCTAIRTALLPEIAERNAARRTLRIWSAGCSTGEEAYTIAMIAFVVAPLSGWRVDVVGTDVSERALEIARAGEYTQRSLREVPPPSHLLRERDGRYVVAEAVQRMVRFVRHDLVVDPLPDARLGFEPFDLIVCRNVTIYLTAARAREVERRLAGCLADGGYLVLGHSEVAEERPGLERVSRGGVTVFRKAPGAASVLPRPGLSEESPLGAPRPLPSRPGADTGSRTATGGTAPLASPRPAIDELLGLAERAALDGDLARAAQLCESAAEDAPLEGRTHTLLGVYRLELGDVRGAREAFRRALFLDPEDAEATEGMRTLRERYGATGSLAPRREEGTG